LREKDRMRGKPQAVRAKAVIASEAKQSRSSMISMSDQNRQAGFALPGRKPAEAPPHSVSLPKGRENARNVVADN
jgi:hypothetical protein